jgi:hypothetical protein
MCCVSSLPAQHSRPALQATTDHWATFERLKSLVKPKASQQTQLQFSNLGGTRLIGDLF